MAISPYFKSKGLWAVILGGSSGIGLATAKKLASEGLNICIIHRDRRSQLKELQIHFDEILNTGVKLHTVNRDGIKEEHISEIVNETSIILGEEKIRVLVHAISRGNLKTLISNNDENTDSKSLRERLTKSTSSLKRIDFILTLEAMALSLVDWVQQFHDNKLFADDVRVFGLTSEGNAKAWPSYAAVSAAKLALEGICRSIALEFAPFGIRCNVLQPGVTDTPSLRMIPGNEQLKEMAVQRNPYNRLTLPEDVANVIYLLSRDEAKWINGALIPVDGGERNS